jgi:gluconokinase
MQPTGFLVMGVSGSGKSTLGNALARNFGWDFFDADDFHSPENVAKMAAGIPLTDSDRMPWLAALNYQLLSCLHADRHPILACSALKKMYRTQLLEGTHGTGILYLKGSYGLIWSRISARQGHYMKAEMLRSQFEALEEPDDAYILDVSMPLKDVLDTISKNYSMLRRSSK